MSKLFKTRRESALPADRARQAGLRYWGWYMLAIALWAAAVSAAAILGPWICSFFIWYESDPLYRYLSLIRSNALLLYLLAIVIGWVVISYRFIARSAQDQAWLLAGAEALGHPTDTPIQLPDRMKSAEDQLNLAREQALRTAQAAKEAEQRKNDLVVYLAHDLKTPLTSVIGYLTLLQDEPQISPEMRARYTGIALEKSERLEDLINEFFDITRFSLTHLELEKQEIDLKRMLEQMASEFEPVLSGRRMQCRLDLPAPLPLVCDPNKMARVFDNLFNNACHYAYPDSVLAVAGREEDDQVVITFRNAGATIPPEKLDRMFEQFFRLDPSRGTRSGSAGLGLAIAREIVQAHGGTITAQSADEQVVFTVALPRQTKA